MDARQRLQSIQLTFADTTNRDYQKLQSYRNATSYSMLDTLHTCPRKFQLIKARASSGGQGENNIDFAFGHSVGSGIQAWLASKDLSAAIFNGMLAWQLPFEESKPKACKSIWEATLAIEKYPAFHEEFLSGWHVFILPDGRPAIELSLSIDFENGYKHYCHIDAVLENSEGTLAVQENKTTGFKAVDSAIYENSAQALSYAVLVDMLRKQTSYEVFYCVYSSTAREWQFLPFTKTTSLKAEWLLDVQLDHAALTTYKELNFYPKRGENCLRFNRRCEFFGICNMTESLTVCKELGQDEEAERIDFKFTKTQILNRQLQRSNS